MIKAFIFDLDGVITDTAEYHYLAWKQLGKDLGINIDREFNETLKGVSRIESLERILELKKEIDLRIMGITDDMPIGNYQYNYMGLDFITYDEVGKKFGLDASTTGLYINTNGDEDARNLVKDIANQYGYDVTDKMEEIKSMEDTLMVMQIFVYGFVTIISLVSMTNIINTISTI